MNRNLQQHKWLRIIFLVTGIGISLIFYTGCSPRPRHEVMTWQNSNAPCRIDEETRRLLELSPRMDGATFHPGQLLACVNHLQPLGEERVLDVLEAYALECKQLSAGVKPNRSGVFLITLLLFRPTDDDSISAQLRLGVPDPRPRNRSEWPTFPIAVVRDVPYLLVLGYSLGGLPSDPVRFIDYCRKRCRIIDAPLNPENPFDAANELLESVEWKAMDFRTTDESSCKLMIRDQAIRCLPDDKQSIEADLPWEELIRRYSGNSLHWDPMHGKFNIE